jgi:hypothetical protein
VGQGMESGGGSFGPVIESIALWPRNYLEM